MPSPGDTAQAAGAAGNTRAAATDDREKSVALDELGTVQEVPGDLAGARKSFEESHQILAGLAAANPTSAAAQRDLSVSRDKLGGVEEAAGGLGGGAQELRGEPTRCSAPGGGQPDLRGGPARRLREPGQAGDGAVRRPATGGGAQELRGEPPDARRQAGGNPTSAAVQRDVSVTRHKLGDVEVAGGELAGARKSFEESLEHRPAGGGQPDLRGGPARPVGEPRAAGRRGGAAGALAGARKSFEESLRFARPRAGQPDLRGGPARPVRQPTSSATWRWRRPRGGGAQELRGEPPAPRACRGQPDLRGSPARPVP